MIDYDKELKEILKNKNRTGIIKAPEVTKSKKPTEVKLTTPKAKTEKTQNIRTLDKDTKTDLRVKPETMPKTAIKATTQKSGSLNYSPMIEPEENFTKLVPKPVKSTVKKQETKQEKKDFTKQIVKTGITDVNKAIFSTLDMFLPDNLTPKRVQGIIDFYKNTADEERAKLEKKYDTKGKEILGQLATGTIAAIPNLAVAAMTGGASEVGQLTANAASKSGAVKMLQDTVNKYAKDPKFWMSFFQIAGPTHDKEIKNGATETKAMLSAFTNGILGSAIEVGGGIEAARIPKNLKEAGKNILKTAGEEGLEEVKQYSVENLVNKAIGSNTAKWYSNDKSEDAILNPKAQFEQAAYGAAIGGILGGPQQIMGLAANKNANVSNGDPGAEVNEPEILPMADEKVSPKKTIGEPDTEVMESNPMEIPYNNAAKTIGEPETEVEEPTRTAGEPEAEVEEAGIEQQLASDISSMKNNTSRMKPETEAKIIATVAKRSGLNVRFADDLADDIDGYITGNEITINRNAKNPAFQVFKHELTHYLKTANEYDAFKRFVLNEMRSRVEDLDGEITKLQESYRNSPANVELTLEEAEDEYVAKFSEEYLFNSEESINRLARENPNLFRRIYDWIRDTIAKIGASEDTKFLINAQRKYEKALKNSLNERETSSYDYNSLASLKPIRITDATKSNMEQISYNKDLSRNDVYNTTFNNIKKYNEGKNNLGENYLFNKYIGNIRITRDGLSHAFRRFRGSEQTKNAILATTNLPLYLEEAIPINEASGERQNANKAYILIGIFSNGNQRYINRIVVNEFTKEIENVETLYALNTKKEDAAAEAASVQYGFSSSTITIADLLKIVKNNFPNELSQNVADRLGYERGKSDFEGLKYSINQPEKNLVALHNLTEDKLRKALELGGFPSPSIAVIKAGQEHSRYGDVSIVFDRSTIDPKTNRNNKVYGGDAWTPTYPQIDYKPNAKVVKKLRDKYYELGRKYGYDAVRELLAFASDDVERRLQNAGGEENYINQLYEDTDMMQIYLMDSGKGRVEDINKVETTTLSEGEVDQFEFFLNRLGDLINQYKELGNNVNSLPRRKQFITDNIDEFRAGYVDWLKHHDFTEEQIENVLPHVQLHDYVTIMRKIIAYQKNGKETTNTTYDPVATQNAIREKAEDGYREWVDQNFKGIVEKTGIPNGKSYYTDSGNIRSWDARHWENNLENVVKAMKNESDTGNSTIFSGLSLWGVSAKNYRSIDEIRADQDRLKLMNEEEYGAIRTELGERFSEVVRSMMNGKGDDNYFIAFDNACEAVIDALRQSKTKSGLMNILKDSYILSPQEYQVNDLLAIVSDVANMPTEYFEAKPKRAVRFDEVLAAVVPNNTSPEVIERLKERGLNVLTYEAGDEEERRKLIDGIENSKFSLGAEIESNPALRRASEELYGEISNRYYDRDIEAQPEEETENQQPEVTMQEREEPKLTEKAKRYERRQIREKYLNRMLEVLGADKYQGSRAMTQEAKDLVQRLRKGKLTEEEKKKYFNDILFSAVRNDQEFLNDSKNIVGDIRNVRFIIDDEFLKDFTDFNDWRKQHPGFYFVSRNEAGNTIKPAVEISSWYDEMNELYPANLGEETASGQYMTDADRIRRLGDFVDEYKEKEAQLKDVTSDWTDEDFSYAYSEFNKALDELNKQVNIIYRNTEKYVPQAMTDDEINERVQKINNIKKEIRDVTSKVILDSEDEEVVELLLSGRMTPSQVSRNYINSENILTVYEVKAALKKEQEAIRARGAKTKEKISSDLDKLMEKSGFWKDKGDKQLTFMRETAERNLEDIMDPDEAKKLIAYLATPVHENEAAATRFKNEVKESVRALNLSSKPEYSIPEKAGAEADIIGSEEQFESFAKQLDANDGKLSESALVQLKGEGIIGDEFLQVVGADVEKINNAVSVMKDVYDQIYNVINNVLIDYGYDPVEHRADYFPHFEEETPDSFLKKAAAKLGFKKEKSNLPTDIAGLTEYFRPGKKWFGNALHRTGEKTTYDALKGIDMYLDAASDVIYHTADIQRWRAFETAVRTKFGEKGLKSELYRLKGRYRRAEIDDVEYESLRDELLNKGVTSQQGLANWIRDYTDNLAGKKSFADRPVERMLGRSIYDVSGRLEGRVAANMVALNPGSWLTNFIPLVQGGNISYKDTLYGMAKTLQNRVRDDGLMDYSTFVTNRAGTDKLVKTESEKWADVMTSPMQMIDMFVSESLVRGKYNEGIRKGLNHVQAMKAADRFAADVIADRSKGATPTLFNSKNPATKLFTQFQIEVNNQWSHFFKDIPRNAENVRAIASAAARIAIGSYIFNDVYEKLTGRRPALDFLSWIGDFIEDSTGYGLRNFADIIADLLDGEDDNDLFSLFFEEGEKKKGSAIVGDLAENVAQDIPFVGTLLEGGRLPISSALPDVGTIINDVADGLTGDKSPEKVWNSTFNALLGPALYTLPPFGGGQIKKVYETVRDIINEGSYGMDADGNKKLRFAVNNDPQTWVKGLLFGQYAIGNSKDYVESGFKMVPAKKTTIYKKLVENGFKPTEAEEIVRTLEINMQSERTTLKSIEKSDYPVDTKNRIAKTMYPFTDINYKDRNSVEYAELTKTEQETIDEYLDAGFTLEESLDIKKIMKTIENPSTRVKALMLAEGGYKYNEKMGEVLNIKPEAWEIANDAYKVGITAKELKAMMQYAQGYDGSKPNSAISQKEAIAYLKDRDNLTNMQKYYAMRALCNSVADKNNPWAKYK